MDTASCDRKKCATKAANERGEQMGKESKTTTETAIVRTTFPRRRNPLSFYGTNVGTDKTKPPSNFEKPRPLSPLSYTPYVSMIMTVKRTNSLNSGRTYFSAGRTYFSAG